MYFVLKEKEYQNLLVLLLMVPHQVTLRNELLSEAFTC